LAVADKPVSGADDLIRLLGADAIGRTLELKIIRGGKLDWRTVTPRERR
jgi:S1-C subfamily serine protease